jgi:acetyl-CoA carboxylase biotin carboxyl carrier protein
MSAAPSSKSASPRGKADKAVRPTKPLRADRPGNGIANGAAPVEMARELAAIVEAHTLSELILETAGVTLTIRRGFAAGGSLHGGAPQGGMMAQPMMHAPMAHAPAHAPAPSAVSPSTTASPSGTAAGDDKLHVVTSPFVGTFYRSPSPDADPYVREGQKVDKGQVLCIVEAMKLMNEIEADVGGTIVDVLVENGKTVEYGQPLFKISPA